MDNIRLNQITAIFLLIIAIYLVYIGYWFFSIMIIFFIFAEMLSNFDYFFKPNINNHEEKSEQNYNSNDKFTNEDRRRQRISEIIISLAGKIAKADGKISMEESKVLTKLLNTYSESESQDFRSYLKKVLDNEKDNLNNVNNLCVELVNLNFSFHKRRYLIEDFIKIITSNNCFEKKQENILDNIANTLNVYDESFYIKIKELYKSQYNKNSDDNFNQNNNQSKKEFKDKKQEKYNNKEKQNDNFNKYSSQIQSSLKILNSQSANSMDEIKKNYRKLIRQYHYDHIKSKELPEDMIIYAEEKTKEINAAYEIIKKSNLFK